MNRLLLFLIFFLAYFPAFTQNKVAIKYASSITQEDLKDLLTIISSDALEGRETGTRGQKMAAAFIVEEFKRIGLKPIVPTSEGKSYLQKFNLENYSEGSIYLKANETKFSFADNILFKGKLGMKEAFSSQVVFIGANEHENLSQINIKDKIALISCVNTNREGWETLVKKAYENSTSMVILVPFKTDGEFNKYRRAEGRNYARRRYAYEQETDKEMANGYFLVSPSIASVIIAGDTVDILKLLSNNVPERLSKEINDSERQITYFTSLPSEIITTENVLGYLKGSDLKDELIVITAHYDHIGRNGEDINNGADDDGSGTSAVIEIAEAFAKAKAAGHGSRRSILFMTVTGEEKGLIGSQYYTSHPLFPLANTVVDLNIDMIGRHDKVHEEELEFVYLVGSDRLSTELHDLSEQANNAFTQLSLDYTYNDENHPERIYYRSDHWNFAKHNIPIIFYFSGVHEDYHRPTDTIDKIEFNLLQKRAQLIFYTAWVISNRDQRLVVDKIQDTKINTN